MLEALQCKQSFVSTPSGGFTKSHTLTRIHMLALLFPCSKNKSILKVSLYICYYYSIFQFLVATIIFHPSFNKFISIFNFCQNIPTKDLLP